MRKPPRISEREVADEILRDAAKSGGRPFYSSSSGRGLCDGSPPGRRRDFALREATFAYEAMNSGPITEEDEAHVRRVLEAKYA